MFDNIFDEIRRLQKELNRSFGEFWEGEKLPVLQGNNKHSLSLRNPLTDLEETDKEFIASMEIPGVEKQDIQLNITNNNLEVKVEKKHETKVEKKGLIREERSYKGFYRALTLPSEVIPEKARASYKNGVLEVRMPKAEKSKKNKIEIE